MKIRPMIWIVVFVALTTLRVDSSADEKISVIPEPQSIKRGSGELVLTVDTCIGISEGVSVEFAESCANLLRSATGWTLPVTGNGAISFRIAPESSMPDEGYQLKVTQEKAELTASTKKGLFYAFQTLRQLMPVEAFGSKPARKIKWNVPVVEITDAPRFAWRGVLVDVSRKFQSVETMKLMLDAMAACKLNILHWHLTDNQGWRLEIKRYPRLTELSKQFYTQDEIREIVKYAKMRNISIIPEIDIPGHSSAATRAYPELCCKGPDGVKLKRSGIYCPGEKFSYEFMENVLREVAVLFPAPYIHLGADEVGHRSWKKCPDCQAVIKREKLKGTHGLEVFFVQRMVDILRKLGKRAITWDEAFDVQAEKDQIIMSWRGVHPGMVAAEKGHNVIFCPVSALYFDRRNSRSKHQHPGYSFNTVNLDLPYFFEPANPLLSKSARERVMGAQGCIWGEKIKDGKHLMMQAMMRGCALAEATWSSPEKRNWNAFLTKALRHTKRLNAMGVHYFWEPISNAIEVERFTSKELANGTFSVNIDKYVKKSAMYEFIFHRYWGDGTFNVTGVALLKDGVKIAEDSHTHTVTLDPRRPKQFFHLWVYDYDKNAEYTLKITASPVNSNPFEGAIMLFPPLPDDEYSQAGPKSVANGQKYKPPQKL